MLKKLLLALTIVAGLASAMPTFAYRDWCWRHPYRCGGYHRTVVVAPVARGNWCYYHPGRCGRGRVIEREVIRRNW